LKKRRRGREKQNVRKELPKENPVALIKKTSCRD
jgi:hypothetical protein